jgi:hypothetical protein
VKTSSAKTLLEETGSPMDAATLFRALEFAGLVEQKRYVSSSGSGEIKTFWSFTDDGLRLGENKPTISPTKTELRFYESRFHDALIAAADAIINHARLHKANLMG